MSGAAVERRCLGCGLRLSADAVAPTAGCRARGGEAAAAVAHRWRVLFDSTTIAVHEAGHAVVAARLAGPTAVDRIEVRLADGILVARTGVSIERRLPLVLATLAGGIAEAAFSGRPPGSRSDLLLAGNATATLLREALPGAADGEIRAAAGAALPELQAAASAVVDRSRAAIVGVVQAVHEAGGLLEGRSLVRALAAAGAPIPVETLAVGDPDWPASLLRRLGGIAA